MYNFYYIKVFALYSEKKIYAINKTKVVVKNEWCLKLFNDATKPNCYCANWMWLSELFLQLYIY